MVLKTMNFPFLNDKQNPASLNYPRSFVSFIQKFTLDLFLNGLCEFAVFFLLLKLSALTYLLAFGGRRPNQCSHEHFPLLIIKIVPLLFRLQLFTT